jgi:hypothetical protein
MKLFYKLRFTNYNVVNEIKQLAESSSDDITILSRNSLSYPA